MKYKSLRSFFLANVWLFLAQTAWSLDLGVSHSVYYTPDGKPYLEVNLEIASMSIFYHKTENEKLQASAEILILVKKGEEVVNYEKYLLQSPLLDEPRNLADVKRFFIPPGQYELEVLAQDVFADKNRAVFQTLVSAATLNRLHLSELQLLRSFKRDDNEGPFVKNGYFLEPLPFNFYDRVSKRLAFYAEIYQADKTLQAGSEYLLRYFIEQEKGNGIKTLVSAGNQRKKAGTIDALLVQMDISKLESGNYLLTVEARSADNELLAERRLSFQRSNPYLHIDEEEITDEVLEQQFTQALDEKQLKYALAALAPIVSGDDALMLNNANRDKDLRSKRFFIFRYFMRQDPNDPEGAYRKYIKLAEETHERFKSGFRYGFETDRGRAFLRFGPPDDLVHVEDEPGAVPYEIWIYYSFPKTAQSNVKFLFYNPSLAGEDYITLHSTARGELQDPKWERKLYSRNLTEYVRGDNYNDATEVERNFGRRAREYFTDY
jgi:GWxTD domain-containing protein